MKKYIHKFVIYFLAFSMTIWSLGPMGWGIKPALAIAVPTNCQALFAHFPPESGSFSSETEICDFHFAEMIDFNMGTFYIRFYDDASNGNAVAPDTVDVTVTSTSDPTGITVTLTEIAANEYTLPANAANDTGIFGGVFQISDTSNAGATPPTINAVVGDNINISHAGTGSAYSAQIHAMNFGDDIDGDGISDGSDNCPNIPNPDQADANTNGTGDACEGVFAIVGYGPPNGETNMPTMAPLDFMFSSAPHGDVLADLGSYFLVSPSVAGNWAYFQEDWGGQIMHRVSFMPSTGLELGTPYTTSVLKTVTDANGNTVTATIPAFMAALDSSPTDYSFTVTTSATAMQGGFFPPFASAGYPYEYEQQVPISLSAITVNFDRDNMDATTFSGNITLTKVGSGIVGGVTVTPSTGQSNVATLHGFTLDANSEYRVSVTRSVMDTSGQPIVGDGNDGPFSYLFYTGSSTGEVTASYMGTNLFQYDSGGSLVNVPTGIVIEAAFDNPLDPSTVNGTNIRLMQGATPIAGEVIFDAGMNVIRFIPSSVLATNTSYSFDMAVGITSITGQAISASSISFTTTSTADTAKPNFIWVDADNYGLFLEFNEPLDASTAENKNYYTIKTRNDSTAWTSVSALSLTSANVRYMSYENSVMIDGLALTPGNEFQVAVSTSVTDMAGNAVDNTSSANIRTGVVMDADNFFGGGGMFTMDGMGMEDFDMSLMGMMPVFVMPMNSMVNMTTKYFVDIPISSGIDAGGTIELKFPTGFNVSGVIQDAQSPINADFNRPEFGNVVTFAGSDPAGTTTNGVDNDGLGVIGEKTVVIKLSAATLASDFLTLDLDGIVNSSVPRGFETDGYQVEIKTKNSSGILLEALNSMPFFITGGGTNTVAGDIHNVAVGHNGTIQVYLGSPMTGPMDQDVAIVGTGDATADGSYSFANLPDGDYFIFTDPSFAIGAATYFGPSMPEPVWVQGGQTVTRDMGLIQEGTEGNTYSLTVRLIGDFTSGGSDDAVDIFAGSPTGFRVKTVTPGNTAGTNYTMYLPDGDWMVGAGPAMPQGPMAGPPPMPDWMPPVPLNVSISGDGITINENSGTANDGTIVIDLGTQTANTVSGSVVDENANGIANAEVFAYQPNGGFGGAHTKTAADGSFALKVPVTGLYSIGAYKPGLPQSTEQVVDVQANVTGVTIKMQMPSYTISGKVLNSSGNGVGYAPVWAYDNNSWQHSETMTDATGNYILYVDNGSWTVETDVPGMGWLQYPSAVAVSGASVSGINLQPDANNTYYTITGNVSINGAVQSYIPIRAVEFDGSGNYMGREYGASTDSLGNYEISVLGPVGAETQKLYRVDIWTPEYGEVAANNLDGDATPNEAYPTDDKVENNPANVIVTNANLTNVDILVAAADLNNVSIVFANKVDYPDVDAFVHIEGFDVANDRPTGFYKSVMIDDISGATTVVKLPDGNFHFFVDVPGYGGYIPNEAMFDSPTTPGYIDVSDASADSNTATFALPDLDDNSAIVTVNGTVTSGGSNVEDAWVWVGDPNTGFHKGTSTDSNGQYSVTLPVLASGNYMIGADKPGYMSQEPATLDLTDTTPADGVADSAQDFVLTIFAQTISGYIYADIAGGTANSMDSGEELPFGWVYAEEITTGTMAHSPVDGSGFYSLGVIDGDWRVYGAADGYIDTQYSEAGFYTLITVAGANQANKNIKLDVDANWENNSQNKPMVPSVGGVMDDTGTDGTGVKITVPANALGNSSSSGTISVNDTSAVAKTNSAEPFAGEGKNITANDNSGQPITNLNDFIDLEMVIYKADVDTEVTAGNLVDYSKLKTLQVGYFDATLNDWVGLSTTRTAYYKTLSTDTEWTIYAGDATQTGFAKFIDDALVNGTFTAFEDYKFVFKSATNHLTIFGVISPTDGVAPAAPTNIVQNSGHGTSVILDWDNNAESDLMEYEIYRSTSAGVNKTSTQVNTSQVATSAFTDSSTTAWTSYFYTVTAADDSGNESAIATELQVCSSGAVSNGTVAVDCTITCNAGFTQSGNTCAASGGGGGGYSSSPAPVVTEAPTTTEEDTTTVEEEDTTVVEQPSIIAPTQETVIGPIKKAVTTVKNQVFSLVQMSQDAATIVTSKIDSFLQKVGLKSDPKLEADTQVIVRKITGIQRAEAEVISAVENFVTYGTASTFILGAGERAGVVDSYYAAFGILPETEAEWNDVVKIANGRWPGEISEAREAWASKVFQQVYLRAPDRTNPNDDAAVVIVAYGLRPADRNLTSEQIAIRHFEGIFGYSPADAEDWDTVRAVAYSGATR